MNLQEENEKLKSQLAHARLWMQHEIESSEKIIQKEKTHTRLEKLISSSRESIVLEEIYNFFPSEILSYFPENGIENILSSELIFYQIIEGLHIDGMGVIIGYQKILDTMIELYITKGFRKYIQKNNLKTSPYNSPLEKSLYSIIDKKYILSVGRLYQIIHNIKNSSTLGYYESIFKSYLGEKSHLKKALLETDFFLQLKGLVDIHAMSEKRHSGFLSKKDTLLAREILIGNLQSKNCIIYILAASQATEV